jgi:hypothetical protein
VTRFQEVDAHPPQSFCGYPHDGVHWSIASLSRHVLWNSRYARGAVTRFRATRSRPVCIALMRQRNRHFAVSVFGKAGGVQTQCQPKIGCAANDLEQILCLHSRFMPLNTNASLSR